MQFVTDFTFIIWRWKQYSEKMFQDKNWFYGHNLFQGPILAINKPLTKILASINF